MFSINILPNPADANINIDALDIPVNAVATGLKDFFSKHLPPLFDKDLMTELEDIAGEFLSELEIIILLPRRDF